MDFEEFQESDVMFSYDHSWGGQINGNYEIQGPRQGQYRKGLNLPRSDAKEKQQQRIISSPRSLPVNIQAGSGMTGYSRYDIDVAAREPFDQSSDEDQDDYDFEADDEIMGRLPPHLIVERRVSGEIARSFSPLKGRNLCQRRNSILRMTGFLER